MDPSKGDISPCIMDLGFQELTEDTVGKIIKSACEKYYIKEAKSSPDKEKVINLNYNKLESLDTQNIPDIVQRLSVNVNKLQQVPSLKDSKNLIELSLSFNEISSLDVACLPLQLQELKLNGNKIKVVPNLQKFKQLRVLHLNDNEIETMEGLPESIESLELDGNNIRTLAIECFPNQKVFDVVKGALKDEQVERLQYPIPSEFQKGYPSIMKNLLKLLKRKLNKFFPKHPSLKVQGLYIDSAHHKLVVNVKEGELLKVQSMLDSQDKPHVEIIEQPNSPKLLAGNTFKSGSAVQMDAKNTTGTIAAKVVDNQGNIYALTCKHIFSNGPGAQKKTNVGLISAKAEDGTKMQLGNDYYGILGADELQAEDDVMVDVALVPITISDQNCIQKFKSDVKDIDGKSCYLHLYKGEDNCSEDLDSSKVCKFGAETGYTTGVLFSDGFTYYYKKDQLNSQPLEVIMIKGHGQSNGGVFLQEGDSGSLITTSLNHSETGHVSSKNHAIGLAMAKHKDMNVLPTRTVGEPTQNKIQAALAVKLHICLEALENKFPELKGLKICCNELEVQDCP